MAGSEGQGERTRRTEAESGNVYTEKDVEPVTVTLKMLLSVIEECAVRQIKLPMRLDRDVASAGATGAGEMQLNLTLAEADLNEGAANERR